MHRESRDRAGVPYGRKLRQAAAGRESKDPKRFAHRRSCDSGPTPGTGQRRLRVIRQPTSGAFRVLSHTTLAFTVILITVTLVSIKVGPLGVGSEANQGVRLFVRFDYQYITIGIRLR